MSRTPNATVRRHRRRRHAQPYWCGGGSTVWRLWILAFLAATTTTTRWWNNHQRLVHGWHSTSIPWTISSRHTRREALWDAAGVPTTAMRRRFGHEQMRLAATALFMGKGDGKKKRPKQTSESTVAASSSSSATSSTSAAQQSAPPPPRRVSTNVNIPVRAQIAMANINKEYEASRQGGFRQQKVARTSYRRAWDEEEIETKALERRQRGQDPNWDVILNRTAAAPLMIVDGYNIIHKWPRLKKHMQRGDAAHARQLLLDDLENLRCVKGWRIECVFDGTKRSTMGPLGQKSTSSSVSKLNQATKQSVSKYGVRVVFSGVGSEADAYIEGRCARAKNVTDGAMTGSLIVATDDAMIRVAGQNAGAVCMSADRFVDELKAVKKSIEYQVEVAVARVNGHAVRPEQLRGRAGGGAKAHSAVVLSHRFGRRSVLLEDKRNRTKTTERNVDETYDIDLSDIKLEVDEHGIPWWAKVPDQTPSPYK